MVQRTIRRINRRIRYVGLKYAAAHTILCPVEGVDLARGRLKWEPGAAEDLGLNKTSVRRLFRGCPAAVIGNDPRHRTGPSRNETWAGKRRAVGAAWLHAHEPEDLPRPAPRRRLANRLRGERRSKQRLCVDTLSAPCAFGPATAQTQARPRGRGPVFARIRVRHCRWRVVTRSVFRSRASHRFRFFSTSPERNQ